MSILRNPLKSDYSKIPNALISDIRISAGAFRVACYLFSKNDGWEVNNGEIKKTLGIGQNATIAGYWKELLLGGWLTRERVRGDKNNFIGGHDYTLVLEPILGDNHIVENPTLGKTQRHNKTDHLSKTERNNNPPTPLQGECESSLENEDGSTRLQPDIGGDARQSSAAKKTDPPASRRPPADWDAVLRLRATPSLDATVMPSDTGGAWERRMFVFDAVRRKYPGTKAGLLTAFNGLLQKCYKDKLDMDKNLGKMLFAVLYQAKCKEAKDQTEEFFPAWKNFSTWINGAHWEDEMGSWKGKAEWFNSICPDAAKAEVEKLKNILPCK